jgi:hypothetical protein
MGGSKALATAEERAALTALLRGNQAALHAYLGNSQFQAQVDEAATARDHALAAAQTAYDAQIRDLNAELVRTYSDVTLENYHTNPAAAAFYAQRNQEIFHNFGAVQQTARQQYEQVIDQVRTNESAILDTPHAQSLLEQNRTLQAALDASSEVRATAMQNADTELTAAQEALDRLAGNQSVPGYQAAVERLDAAQTNYNLIAANNNMAILGAQRAAAEMNVNNARRAASAMTQINAIIGTPPTAFDSLSTDQQQQIRAILANMGATLSDPTAENINAAIADLQRRANGLETANTALTAAQTLEEEARQKMIVAQQRSFDAQTLNISRQKFNLSVIGTYVPADLKTSSPGGVTGLVEKIITFFIVTAGIIAVLGISVGGVMMMVSMGDETVLQNGKNAIYYSVIGLVVILLAYIMVSSVQSIVYRVGG